ncbi:YncE family protein [Rubrivirga sp. IMCC45206]|uniref:YncE family protein n=1 Tax=Rubrivirga sp. IMCC45206 TaxID=3391614 RepID=UPI00398FC156
MLRLSPLLALAFALTACDTTSTLTDDGFDPSTVDYDVIQTFDYDETVRPLLAARNVLSPTATTDRGDASDYDLMDVVMAGPSGFVVPFDAEGSLMLRFVTDLPDSVAIPFPNLRTLEPDEARYLARWIEAGARDGDTIPFADAHHLLLAGVQAENHVAVLDADTGRLVRRIDFDALGLPSTPYGPHHFAFEPDGSAAYVSLVSAGVVAKVSLDLGQDPDDALLGRTPEGVFATPGMMSLDPSSNRIFVGRSTLSDPLANGFGILDRSTMEMDVIATPFNVPHAMAATPDGRYAITAELTGTQSESRALVYDAVSGDATILRIPADGAPREFIHFSILGAHHMGMGMTHDAGAMEHAGMDHGGMDHSGMNADASMAGYPYTVTLTSRSTDEVLFLTLAEDGTLALDGTAPAGDGPYHAHANHDGSRLLIPDQRGDTVTILDAATRAVLLLVEADALSQPHSPAPSMDGARFFVTSSNLNGAWTPPFLFMPPGTGDREPLGPESFGNLAIFSAAGDLVEVVQLGAYPSGLEPVMVHGGQDHSTGDR